MKQKDVLNVVYNVIYLMFYINYNYLQQNTCLAVINNCYWLFLVRPKLVDIYSTEKKYEKNRHILILVYPS